MFGDRGHERVGIGSVRSTPTDRAQASSESDATLPSDTTFTAAGAVYQFRHADLSSSTISWRNLRSPFLFLTIPESVSPTTTVCGGRQKWPVSPERTPPATTDLPKRRPQKR